MLKRQIKAFCLAALAALVLFAGAGLGLGEAAAQEGRLQDVLNKLDRLERDMRVMSRQLYRRGPASGAAPAAPAARPAAAAVRPAAPPPAAGVRLENAYVARLEARLDDLESEIRSATGSIENFNHSMRQISSRLDKLVADMELRMTDMEKRLLQASARAPSGPAPAAQPGFQASPPRQQITGVARPPSVRQSGPATGGPSFSRPAQNLGAISPNDLAAVRRGENPLPATAQPRATIQGARPPPPPPVVQKILPKGSVQARYRFAQDLVTRAEYDKAAQAFQEFIAAHPDHKLVFNARYWLGRTFYVRHEYRSAAEAFLKGFRGDPKGNKAPDNLLSLGMSLSQMDKKTDACAMFGKLASDFPGAPSRITRLLQRERTRADCG